MIEEGKEGEELRNERRAATEPSGHGGFLSFPIDHDSVLKHLNQDMRDDWFSDVLGYRDLFEKKDSLQAVLAGLLSEGNGQYAGVARTLCDVPKKGLGLRYALETDFYDRFVYQSICTFLIKYYDPLLSTRVFGHRWRDHYIEGSREKRLFKSRIELWQTFEGITHSSLVDGKIILVTDLINYFENISIELIREAFLSKLPLIKADGQAKLHIRNAVQTLCSLLEKWSYSDRHGLPQNRDASSFIANVVLSDVDHRMVSMGYDYFRYVDDIRIVCADDRRARKAVADLISELRAVGMNINSSKTEIINLGHERVSDFFPVSDSRSAAIDAMWKSRSRRIISRSVPLVFGMLADLIKAGDTQLRQFRFAVNRLKILLDSGMFVDESDVAGELVDLVIDSLETQAVSTDQFCRVLSFLAISQESFHRIERFMLDSVISIHPWQNYHLWMLLALKEYKTDAIVALAERKVAENLASPEIPAIFVYLASVREGGAALKQAIEHFSGEWSYQHQRYLLLATREFDKEDLRPLFGKLGIRVQGTAIRAKSYVPKQGSLVCIPRSTNLVSFYDEISVYD
ncbi:RNA-directed DNA polymerase [Stenotrophomonas sp. NPDC077421]|uniref:RNA-directed DNA polymerase n=1 Tax=Stenotrophomonas sp. NPDC077421 TaxID=3414699 RepID=UPI003C308BA3